MKTTIATMAALITIGAGSLKAQQQPTSTPVPAYDYLTGKRSPEGEWYYGTGREKTSDLPTIAQGDRSNQNSISDVVAFIKRLGFNLGIQYTIACVLSITVVSGYLLGRNGRKK
jgi:hypothetical protein